MKLNDVEFCFVKKLINSPSEHYSGLLCQLTESFRQCLLSALREAIDYNNKLIAEDVEIIKLILKQVKAEYFGDFLSWFIGYEEEIKRVLLESINIL